MAQLRRFYTRVTDSANAAVASPTVTLLRVGALVTRDATAGVPQVGVRHPGALVTNDVCYVLRGGALIDGLTVTLADPSWTYDSGNGDWYMEYSAVGSWTPTAGDRLVLTGLAAGHKVSVYDNDSASGSAGDPTVGSDGVVSGYVKARDVDVKVVSGSTTSYVTDVPTEGRDYVTPQEFGAVGDGSTDDTIAINTAIEYATNNGYMVLMPAATYRTTDPILISCDFDGRAANLDPDFEAEECVIIASASGDDPDYLTDVNIWLPELNGHFSNPDDLWTTDNTGVRITHLRRCRVFFNYMENFKTGVHVISHEKGTIDCEFHLGFVANSKFPFKLETVSGRNGWVNENNFYGGVASHKSGLGVTRATSGIRMLSLIAGNRTPDNNVFYKPNLEGVIDEYAIFCQGDWNTFIQPRIEGGDTAANKTICFDGSGATKNLVIGGVQVDEAIGDNADFDVVETNGAKSNCIITAIGAIYPQLESNGPAYRYQHQTDSTKQLVGFYEYDEDMLSTNDNWRTAIGARGFDGKRDTDTVARIRIDPTNGRVVLGDGSTSLGSAPWIGRGSGSPEGVYTAVVGSIYLRTDGGASTTLYVKESGTGNTGWVAK